MAKMESETLKAKSSRTPQFSVSYAADSMANDWTMALLLDTKHRLVEWSLRYLRTSWRNCSVSLTKNSSEGRRRSLADRFSRFHRTTVGIVRHRSGRTLPVFEVRCL